MTMKNAWSQHIEVKKKNQVQLITLLSWNCKTMDISWLQQVAFFAKNHTTMEDHKKEYNKKRMISRRKGKTSSMVWGIIPYIEETTRKTIWVLTYIPNPTSNRFGLLVFDFYMIDIFILLGTQCRYFMPLKIPQTRTGGEP